MHLPKNFGLTTFSVFQRSKIFWAFETRNFSENLTKRPEFSECFKKYQKILKNRWCPSKISPKRLETFENWWYLSKIQQKSNKNDPNLTNLDQICPVFSDFQNKPIFGFGFNCWKRPEFSDFFCERRSNFAKFDRTLKLLQECTALLVTKENC